MLLPCLKAKTPPIAAQKQEQKSQAFSRSAAPSGQKSVAGGSQQPLRRARGPGSNHGAGPASPAPLRPAPRSAPPSPLHPAPPPLACGRAPRSPASLQAAPTAGLAGPRSWSPRSHTRLEPAATAPAHVAADGALRAAERAGPGSSPARAERVPTAPSRGSPGLVPPLSFHPARRAGAFVVAGGIKKLF